MRDDDPALLDRLEADLAAVEHAIGRLEQISSESDDVAGAGDLAGRIRSVVEVPPFLAGASGQPVDPGSELVGDGLLDE